MPSKEPNQINQPNQTNQINQPNQPNRWKNYANNSIEEYYHETVKNVPVDIENHISSVKNIQVMILDTMNRFVSKIYKSDTFIESKKNNKSKFVTGIGIGIEPAPTVKKKKSKLALAPP